MGSVLGDLRLGLRQVFRHRGMTVAALLSLSLGIGAKSALFGTFHALLWRPLPVPSPERLAVPRPFLFVPVGQHFRNGRTLVIRMRAADDLAATVSSVRQVASAIDPTLPVFNVRSMEQFMQRAYLKPKLASLLIAPAGALA